MTPLGGQGCQARGTEQTHTERIRERERERGRERERRRGWQPSVQIKRRIWVCQCCICDLSRIICSLACEHPKLPTKSGTSNDSTVEESRQSARAVLKRRTPCSCCRRQNSGILCLAFHHPTSTISSLKWCDANMSAKKQALALRFVSLKRRSTASSLNSRQARKNRTALLRSCKLASGSLRTLSRNRRSGVACIAEAAQSCKRTIVGAFAGCCKSCR